MSNKRAGARSQQQNDFLQPSAPINVVATNVGTNRAFNDGAASVAFALPGGSPAATSFTVKAYKPSAEDPLVRVEDTLVTNNTGTTSPIEIRGLDSDISYTFKVSATNTAGTSALSAETTAITITTVPATPAAPTVQNFANNQNDTVTWVAPASGGSAITNYAWESTDSKSGTTTPPTVSVVVLQEANTSQQYRVRAINTNGSSPFSDYSISNTTPPFFPPGFGPFFPPPFFPPFFRCVEENTLIDTPRGLVAAKDIKIGESLYAVSIAELDTDQRATRDFNIGSTFTLTNPEPVETQVTVIKISMKSEIMYFNDNYEAKFSDQHTMFAKVDGQYVTKSSGELKVGDYLLRMQEDGSYIDEEITSINMLEIPTPVYEFSCEPYHWFIAGGYLVHNYK
jgi:hypothetical protein